MSSEKHSARIDRIVSDVSGMCRRESAARRRSLRASLRGARKFTVIRKNRTATSRGSGHDTGPTQEQTRGRPEGRQQRPSRNTSTQQGQQPAKNAPRNQTNNRLVCVYKTTEAKQKRVCDIQGIYVAANSGCCGGRGAEGGESDGVVAMLFVFRSSFAFAMRIQS